jgi:hydrogenase/urease accessory protein HupE
VRLFAFVSSLALLLWPSSAAAHAIGLSRGEYAAEGTAFTGSLTFAANDAPDAARIARGLHVRASGVACETRMTEVAKVEGDGVRIEVRGACPTSGSIEIEAAFLDDLPAGHRHLARSPTSEAILSGAQRTFSFASAAPPARSRFLAIGFEHILEGYDHLAFVLALAIAATSWRNLLGVVTAFTLGHSVSLALASLGVFAPSARFIEPTIALTIVWVGVQNLRGKAAHRWRITLPFGLVHGFGFAYGLRQLAVPRSELPWALALFNVGVELGQLAVLAVIVPILLLLAKNARFREHGPRTINLAVVLAGLVWFVSRVFSS